MVFLGMGEDGHVASLFPGEPEEVMANPADLSGGDGGETAAAKDYFGIWRDRGGEGSLGDGFRQGQGKGIEGIAWRRTDSTPLARVLKIAESRRRFYGCGAGSLGYLFFLKESETAKKIGRFLNISEQMCLG